MKMKYLIILLLLSIISCSKEDTITPNDIEESIVVTIPKGIISTGSRGVPIPQEIIDHPLVDGFMVIAAWKDVEISENNFDWSFIDSEINRASTANKKVRIAIHTGGPDVPNWVMQNYPSIKEIFVYDKQTLQKTYHPAYWDEIFIEVKSNFQKALAERYNESVPVFAISAAMVDPNTGDWLFESADAAQVQSYIDAGFTELGFINAYKKLIDNTMANFKNKIVITAVGPIPTSLVSDKYFALYEVLNYAFDTYDDRLIIAKGSLQAKTPNPTSSNSLIAWQTMWDFKPHCAGQLVWSATNDPGFKMNGGVAYTNIDSIYAAAFNIGALYELNWIEPWKADILNPDLQDELEYARNILIQ